MYVTVLYSLFVALMTGAIAQFDLSCVTGQQPGFPWNLDTCFTCVSFDGSTLCNVGEIDCKWGPNPTDPVCVPAPVTKCHPDDIIPTIDPFLASLVGGQPCSVCLNVDTLQRCLGTEDEICDWKLCSEEVGIAASPDTNPSQQSCQPGDTAPVSTDGQCWACLNNNNFQVCMGSEMESCFWSDCALVNARQCEPGTEIEAIGRLQCNLKCVNSHTGELCVDSDVACGFNVVDASCFDVPDDVTVPVTVDPCPEECSPGAVIRPLPGTDCTIDCRNIDTHELCVDGDRCCKFNSFEASCVQDLPPLPTTLMPEAVCQPEDTPPISPEIACYKCLSRNGGACVPNTYCEWLQVDDTLCMHLRTTEPTQSPHTTLTTPVKGVTSKRKGFSVTFQNLTCKTIIGDEKRQEEFVRLFTQQIIDLIGTTPMEIQLSCGSIVVEFTLEKKENDHLDDLAEKLKKEVEAGQLNINVGGREYTASAFKRVEDNINETNPPKMDPTHPLTYVYWFIVVGVIAVAIVAVFMVIVFMYLDYHCRQQRRKAPPTGSDNKAYNQDWDLKTHPNMASDVTYIEEDQDFGDG